MFACCFYSLKPVLVSHTHFNMHINIPSNVILSSDNCVLFCDVMSQMVVLYCTGVQTFLKLKKEKEKKRFLCFEE